MIKSLSNFALKQGFINADPLQWVDKVKRRKKDIKQQRVLTRGELSKVFITANEIKPNFLPALIFYANTGCRLNELSSLEWSDIDFKMRSITFNVKPHILIRNEPFTCKSGSQRIIPMKDVVYDYLMKLPKTNNWVFFSNRDRNTLGDYIYRNFKIIFKSSPIERTHEIKVHTFRHTFVSQLLKDGVSLTDCSKLAGHSNTTTTDKYAHIINSTKSDSASMNQMPDIVMMHQKCTIAI